MKVIIFILLVSFSSACFAQKEINSASLKISYFGEMITHPGLKCGIEYSLLTRNISKETKRKTKEKKCEIIIGSNLGAYTHFKYNTGVFLNGEIGYRTTRSTGNIFDFMFGAGYLRTFLNSETFEIGENAEVNKVFLAGNNSFMPSVSFGFGRDISQKSEVFDSWYLKPIIFLQTQHNSGILPHLALEAGLNFQLNK
ncbi:MAG: hypothetical protein JXA77_19090 [Bacteroidales bacterium]|nr:hypothetical protein [Bacteroidales bacterium]MBN2821396.1 hypothetical protein [Bacteroidales bacterium]